MVNKSSPKVKEGVQDGRRSDASLGAPGCCKMGSKVKDRDHMPRGGRGEPSSDEKREIEELRALIGTSPARGSTLQQSTFMRWQVGEENRKRAEEARLEREAQKALKEEIKAKRLAAASELREKAQEQQRRNRQIMEDKKAQSLQEGKDQREKEALWQQTREANHAKSVQKGRALVEETRERQKRMDKNEANQDRKEREEGTRDKNAREEAFKIEKQQQLEAKRAKVAKVKQETDPEFIKNAVQWAAQKRTGSAEDKRKMQAFLKSQRRRGKEGHLDKAREIKGQVTQIKENARQVQERLRQKKANEAGKERANDHLVEQEKLRVLANKKKDHELVYKKRYANAAAAEKWESTPTFAKPNLSSLDPSVSGGGLFA